MPKYSGSADEEWHHPKSAQDKCEPASTTPADLAARSRVLGILISPASPVNKHMHNPVHSAVSLSAHTIHPLERRQGSYIIYGRQPHHTGDWARCSSAKPIAKRRTPVQASVYRQANGAHLGDATGQGAATSFLPPVANSPSL